MRTVALGTIGLRHFRLRRLFEQRVLIRCCHGTNVIIFPFPPLKSKRVTMREKPCRSKHCNEKSDVIFD